MVVVRGSFAEGTISSVSSDDGSSDTEAATEEGSTLTNIFSNSFPCTDSSSLIVAENEAGKALKLPELFTFWEVFWRVL